MSENRKCWICGRTEEQAREDFKQLAIDSNETDTEEKKVLKDDKNLYIVPRPDEAANFFTIPIRTEVRRKLCDGYLQFKGESPHLELPLCTVCASVMNHLNEQSEVL